MGIKHSVSLSFSGRIILQWTILQCLTAESSPKTVIVTMLLLFGHVTLLCGTFLFMFLSELYVYCNSYTYTYTHILPPEAAQCQSKISPLTASETFTQRRRWNIGEGSPHSRAM